MGEINKGASKGGKGLNRVLSLDSFQSVKNLTSLDSFQSVKNLTNRVKSTKRRTIEKRLTLAERDQIELDENKSARFKWWHAIFIFSGVSLLACLLQLFLPYPYGAMMSSAEIAAIGIAPGCQNGLTRCICPRETICATSTLSIVLLAIARCTVFFDYPLYMMMFLSKCHNINNLLRRTVLREWIDFAGMHKVHKIFGIVVGVETMSHSFFHMLRWGLNQDINLLWNTVTGATGVIAAFVTPIICWPMAIEYLKKRIKFEVRKGLHYLSVVWAVALLFHAPSRIYYLIGVPGAVYLFDYVLGYFVRNSLLENVFFERYGENGVALNFRNPLSWEDKPKTSYVYVMCPWISKYQWHAFTMFPEPQKEDHTMLCIGASGDWTKALHDKIKVPCYRPMYVIGPFKSEFSDAAVGTSNAIAVASGIGITPTLSLTLNYADKKRINIVWMCRDAGLIEYILHKVDIGALTKRSYVFIFYTGKRKLALPPDLPSSVFIIKSRPNLEHTITGIVASIHSGEGLPETMLEAQQKLLNAPVHERMMIALCRVVETYGTQEMFEYAVEETEKAAASKTDIDLESGGTSGTVSLATDDTKPSGFASQGQVSLQGLDAMIVKFLGGIGEYSNSDLETFFKKIDTDGSGFIDEDEFEEFLNLATFKKIDTDGSGFIDEDEFVKFLGGIGEYSNSDLRTFFKKIDTDGSGFIDEDEFKEFRNLATQGELISGKGKLVREKSKFNTFESALGDDTTIEYMKTIANPTNGSENPLEDWSIFYCGGSNKIKSDLKDIARKYGLGFAVEKFDW